MNPKQYTGQEWTQLLNAFDNRRLRNALKKAYRAEAKKMKAIALRKLHNSGLNTSTGIEKGLRTHIYSRGGGFMVTVKARKAKWNGKGEKGMHTNRAGVKKPILMWAEDGTKERITKTATRVWTRSRKSHSTGKMPAYRFLDKAQDEMYTTAEQDLVEELGKAVEYQAKKAGFI